MIYSGGKNFYRRLEPGECLARPHIEVVSDASGSGGTPMGKTPGAMSLPQRGSGASPEVENKQTPPPIAFTVVPLIH